jgi:chlorite dismutase
MDKGRARIEPPDLSEKGGLKDGSPQRSDDRLFVQLLAFGGCDDAMAVARQLQDAGVEGAVYEDVNDPRGIAVVSIARTPETFVERVRPALKTGVCAALVLKPDYTMLGRTYALGYEPDLNETVGSGTADDSLRARCDRDGLRGRRLRARRPARLPRARP